MYICIFIYKYIYIYIYLYICVCVCVCVCESVCVCACVCVDLPYISPAAGPLTNSIAALWCSKKRRRKKCEWNPSIHKNSPPLRCDWPNRTLMYNEFTPGDAIGCRDSTDRLAPPISARPPAVPRASSGGAERARSRELSQVVWVERGTSARQRAGESHDYLHVVFLDVFVDINTIFFPISRTYKYTHKVSGGVFVLNIFKALLLLGVSLPFFLDIRAQRHFI